MTAPTAATGAVPTPIDPKALGGAVRGGYDNRALARVNDHEIRMSVMTTPFGWHCHPSSDETFLVVEGGLVIDFETGSVTLEPGQLLTVPRGVTHRTRPVGKRSINLTFEKAEAETIFL